MRLGRYATYLALCSCSLTGCVFLPHPEARLQAVDVVDRSDIGLYRQTVKAGALQPNAVAIRFSETGRFPNGLFATVHFCDEVDRAYEWKVDVFRLPREQNGTEKEYSTYAIFLNIKTPYYVYQATQPPQYDLSNQARDICFETFESGRYFPPFSNVVEVPASSLKAAFARGVISLPASWKPSLQYGP